MTGFMKLKCCKTKSTASVVDGKLVLSFPGALTPVVWQMDFSQVKASALEVRHNEDKTAYTLVLKTPKGETMEVAPFAAREEAIEGLMAASRALENAHGRIIATGSVANDTGVVRPTVKNRGRWLWPLAAIVILLILTGLWGGMAPRPPASVGSTATSAPAAGLDGGENGVPLSADDFLKRQ